MANTLSFGTRKCSNLSAAATTASASKSSDSTTKAPLSDENVNELIEKFELILVECFKAREQIFCKMGSIQY